MSRHPDMSRSASLPAVVLFLLMMAPWAGLSETVQVVQNKVGKNAVITITRDGQPLVDVRVSIDELQSVRAGSSSSHIAEGTTDSNGEISMSGLPAGLYAVFVRVDGKRHWLGNLDVSPEVADEQSHAKYDMFPKFPLPCGRSPDPLRAHLQQLRGSVADSTGAVIPNAEIEVYPAGSQHEEPSVRLKTDRVGRFAAELEPGDYIVIFKSRGFMQQKVAVAVDPKGWHGMQVSLAIATSDCGSAVSGHESKVTEEK
jgi:5-hydroxyisourate hydrolase-like protein (transthyretin family)